MTIESLSTDQSPTPESLLLDLRQCAASGVLEISHPGDEVSYVWVREGRIYAMQVPGYRPALGIRLLSGGIISPEQLSAAAAEQRERFPTDLIGHVLVRMGLVSQEVIDAFVRDQVLDQVADLLDLTVLETAFHPGRRVQHDVIAPTDVEELLAVACQRRATRADVLAMVGGPYAVPALAPPGQGGVETPLGPYDWALLCRVDGRRDVTELARVCGYTVHEAAQMVADLTMTGMLVMPDAPEPVEEPLATVVALHPDAPLTPPVPQWQFDGTDAGEPEPIGDLLAELSAFAHEAPAAELPMPLEVPLEVPLEPEVRLPDARAEGSLPLDVPAATEGPEGGEPVAAVPPNEAMAALVEAPTAIPVPSVEAPAESLVTSVDVTAEGLVASVEAQAEGSVASVDVTAEGLATSVQASPEGLAPAANPAPPLAPTPQGTAAPHTPPPNTAAPTGSSPMFPPGAPVAQPSDQPGYADTRVFMRELSSLSDDTDDEAPVVTRMVVPFTEPKRKRRFWSR